MGRRKFRCIPSKKHVHKQKGLSETLNVVPSHWLYCEPTDPETPCLSLEPAGPGELREELFSHCKPKIALPRPPKGKHQDQQ